MNTNNQTVIHMQRYITKALAAVASLLLLNACCEHRPIKDGINFTALIPIDAYWDEAGITAQNATVLVYNPDGTLYLEKGFECNLPAQNEGHTTVNLAPGTYTVVIFNELRDQIDHIRIRGHQNLSTLEAYIEPRTRGVNTFSRATRATFVNNPEHLAVWKGEITITPEMVDRSYIRGTAYTPTPLDDQINTLTNLHPLRKTQEVNVTVEVENVYFSRMPVIAELHNMSQGYHFLTDRNIMTLVFHQFEMYRPLVYEPTEPNGSIEARINVFGLPGDRTSKDDVVEPILVDLHFKLIDEEQTRQDRLNIDVTDQITFRGSVNTVINLDIRFTTDPELPPVTAPGLNTNTNPWFDHQIDLNLGGYQP